MLAGIGRAAKRPYVAQRVNVGRSYRPRQIHAVRQGGPVATVKTATASVNAPAVS